MAQLLGQENGRFREVWDSLAPGQRLVLLAVADGASALLSEGVRKRYPPGPASSVQHALARLVAADIIDSDLQGGYSVVDPLLRAWLLGVARP